MAFEKLSAPTLKELFVHQLETMILSGELPIGTKLPPERELSATMQISRSVVNAGIVEMADKGFLEIVPRVGTYVADYHLKGRLDTLVSVLKYNGGRLPQAEIRSILELRCVLLNFALELAIPRLTADQFSILETHCERLLDAADPKAASEIIFEFDHLISGYSGNTLLPLIFYSFKTVIMTLWERYFRRYGAEGMHRRTVELLRHMRARDAESAKSVIRNSISATISGATSIYDD